MKMSMSKEARVFTCKNHPDKFCYVCGEFIITKQRNNITNVLQEAYFQYFGFAAAHLNKKWTPSVVCNSCKLTLNSWASGAKKYALLEFRNGIFCNNLFDLKVFEMRCADDLERTGEPRNGLLFLSDHICEWCRSQPQNSLR